MKNTLGNTLKVTLFGESHGQAIGAVIDGITPGIKIDTDFVEKQLSRRRPHGDISTSRKESDNYQIVSGVVNGTTTGTPICIIIPNRNTASGDYSAFSSVARPGHADYTANCKYHGFQDFRGGGHFSGRITAALVAAGAIIQSALADKGILIGTHIKRCARINDADFSDYISDIKQLEDSVFPALDTKAGEDMQRAIADAKASLDSVGGILETAVVGMPCGVGEPWFDSIESMLSHALFSIPAIKGVEFGDGFACADMTGSQMNDEFCIENGEVKTKTNHNGGINGGISNGMPMIFRCAVKPTPSIAKPQKTVDFNELKEAEIEIHGRHDPAIVHRAAVVVDSVAAIVICDLLLGRYGTDWLAK